jgi:hypothetical protein
VLASLIATTGASVVSCGFVSRTSNSDDNNGNDEKDETRWLDLLLSRGIEI